MMGKQQHWAKCESIRAISLTVRNINFIWTQICNLNYRIWRTLKVEHMCGVKKYTCSIQQLQLRGSKFEGKK